jgi:hypothetical protein
MMRQPSFAKRLDILHSLKGEDSYGSHAIRTNTFGLVHKILSDVGNLVVQLRHFDLGLVPLLRELLLAVENTLQLRHFHSELFER